jgi:hypothetical protein
VVVAASTLAMALGLGLGGCRPPEPPAACPLGEADWQAMEAGHSAARFWDEVALAAIRKDLPQPTVHARNLFHLSAAMYDAWAAYDAVARGVFVDEKHTGADVEAARAEALDVAAHRVLVSRYGSSAGAPAIVTCFELALQRRGSAVTHDAEAHALGDRVAATILDGSLDDGSNEANGYADTTGFQSPNPPLVVAAPGTTMPAPDHWQPLQLGQAFTQNGIPQGTVQPYVGAQWGEVRPFALTRDGGEGLYADAGPPPSFADAALRPWVLEVLSKQAALEVTQATVDISPGALGHNSLGANDGTGYSLNPVTGQPYAPQVVPVGDFGRVLAELWADGPKSETPPGHWNLLANQVADAPGFQRRWRGQGASLAALEWDVKVYLALNAALHDAAIAAWQQKRATSTARPISLARYFAVALGQSSDPAGASYSAQGLPLVPGLLELVTAASSAPGQRHQDLADAVGQLAVRAWRGQPASPSDTVAGVGWRLLSTWVPYQKATFVTPAFPGFISGHSTFSRAAAEVLADVTGSPFFPGGLASYTAEANTFLTFEEGPSVRVQLQWATYFDAADQAGQSRLWGGIHLQPDDFEGRRVGAQVGRQALARARRYIEGPAAGP